MKHTRWRSSRYLICHQHTTCLIHIALQTSQKQYDVYYWYCGHLIVIWSSSIIHHINVPCHMDRNSVSSSVRSKAFHFWTSIKSLKYNICKLLSWKVFNMCGMIQDDLKPKNKHWASVWTKTLFDILLNRWNITLKILTETLQNYSC